MRRQLVSSEEARLLAQGPGQRTRRASGKEDGMSIRVSHEAVRGCGYRVEGGLYLVSGRFNKACGRFPLPIDRCPTCSHGLKFTRGLQWFNAKEFFKPGHCGDDPVVASELCVRCPAGLNLPEHAGLLWIGVQSYPTPESFLLEATVQGISRRISTVPKQLELGKTWVFLAHPRAFSLPCPCGLANTGLFPEIPAFDVDCPDCEGKGVLYKPGVIGVFKPMLIEQVVNPRTTDEEADALRKRGIEPVIVVPLVESAVAAQA